MRRTVSALWAISFWAGMMMPAAGGSDPIDMQVLALQQKGYTHFQITRRLLSAEIDAYAPYGSHMHLELAKESGDIIEVRLQKISPEDYSRAVDAVHGLASGAERQNPQTGGMRAFMQFFAEPRPSGGSVSGVSVHGAHQEDGEKGGAGVSGTHDSSDDDGYRGEGESDVGDGDGDSGSDGSDHD